MSKKGNIKRQKYAEKQEKNGQKVIIGIIVGLIILATISAIWTISSLG